MHNSTFGKSKLKVIDKVEFRDRGDLIIVSTKDAIESTIMKENSSRFKLACISQLLEGDLCDQLGMLGEGILSEEILNN